MNQQTRNCNECKEEGHILRFCPTHRCTDCEVLGHAERDCPRQFRLRKFCLWLPYTMGARVGISQTPLREVPGVGRNLQLIRSAGATNMNGSTFETHYNSLRINYGGGSIVIAMQDAPTDAETLVQIRNVRQGGENLPCIRIGAKYTIMGGKLTEDINRLATGSRQQQSPQGDTHVLIYLRDMNGMTAALEVNGETYYMEWERRWVNQELRAEVFVSTERAYRFRMRNPNRVLVQNTQLYFRGENQGHNAVEVVREINQPAVAENVREQILVEAITEPVVINDTKEAVIEKNTPAEKAVGEQQAMAKKNQAENKRPATEETQSADEQLLTGERFAIPVPKAATPTDWYEASNLSTSESEGDRLVIDE